MKKSKPKKILTPHDLLFKKSLENKEAAVHFVQKYMPSDTLSLINLNRLEVQHVTFIEQDLTTSASDVIFRVETVKGEAAYLYFIFEHQRKADRTMPFRLLRYMIKLMELHLQKYQTELLPLVLPFLVFNGQTKYPYSLDIFDLFDESVREKARSTLVQPYPLLDLSQYNLDEVKDDAWIASLLAALKYGPSKKIAPKALVKNIGVYLVNLAADRQLLYIECIIRYINEVQPIEAQDELWEEFEETLKPILGENYMLSIAESLRQEGIQQGMQQGIEQGMLQVARNLLASGFDVEVVAKNTGLEFAVLKSLEEDVRH